MQPLQCHWVRTSSLQHGTPTATTSAIGLAWASKASPWVWMPVRRCMPSSPRTCPSTLGSTKPCPPWAVGILQWVTAQLDMVGIPAYELSKDTATSSERSARGCVCTGASSECVRGVVCARGGASCHGCGTRDQLATRDQATCHHDVMWRAHRSFQRLQHLREQPKVIRVDTGHLAKQKHHRSTYRTWHAHRSQGIVALIHPAHPWTAGEEGGGGERLRTASG